MIMANDMMNLKLPDIDLFSLLGSTLKIYPTYAAQVENLRMGRERGFSLGTI
jgi:hypothetical protein